MDDVNRQYFREWWERVEARGELPARHTAPPTEAQKADAARLYEIAFRGLEAPHG